MSHPRHRIRITLLVFLSEPAHHTPSLEPAPLKKKVSPALHAALEKAGSGELWGPVHLHDGRTTSLGEAGARTIAHVNVALPCVAANHRRQQDFTAQSKRARLLHNSLGITMVPLVKSETPFISHSDRRNYMSQNKRTGKVVSLPTPQVELELSNLWTKGLSSREGGPTVGRNHVHHFKCPPHLRSS